MGLTASCLQFFRISVHHYYSRCCGIWENPYATQTGGLQTHIYNKITFRMMLLVIYIHSPRPERSWLLSTAFWSFKVLQVWILLAFTSDSYKFCAQKCASYGHGRRWCKDSAQQQFQRAPLLYPPVPRAAGKANKATENTTIHHLRMSKRPAPAYMRARLPWYFLIHVIIW